MPKSSWSWGFICSCYMWVWSSMVKLIGWYTYTDPKRELLILGCGMLYRIAPRLDHSGLPPQTPSSELPHYFAWSWFGFLWTDASELWCSVSTAFIPRTFSDQDVSWISAILIHLSNPMLHNWDISYLTIIPLPRLADEVSHDDTELWLADFNTAHHLLAGGSLTMTGGEGWFQMRAARDLVGRLRCVLTWKIR